MHARIPRTPLLAALLATLTVPTGAVALQTPPDRVEAARLFVERNRARLGLPGVAIGIATPDSVLLAVGFGEGARGGRPITGHTPFPIGSVTKTLTAAAVVQLAQEGRLGLDDPIEDHLHGFGLRDPFAPGSITVRHLLAHRSGLRQWSGHDRRAQTEASFEHIAPRGPPGERAEYSSLNYILLGRILEEVAGRPYGAVLDDVLFGPLAMESDWVDGWSERPHDMAVGHQSWYGLQLRRSEPMPPRHLVPAGFAGASAHDLARYGGMLVGEGSFAGDAVLDPETVAAIVGPLDEVAHALGWGRRRIDGRLTLDHAGNARTASARVRLIPEDGLALVVLANTNSGPFFPATGEIMDGVHAILSGEPEPRVWPRERLFKLAVAAGLAFSLVRGAGHARDWGRAGHPVGIDTSTRGVGRLAVDLGVGGVVLFGVPRLVGVPLPTMIEYFPDLGIALVASVGAGVAGGVLRSMTRSGAGKEAGPP